MEDVIQLGRVDITLHLGQVAHDLDLPEDRLGRVSTLEWLLDMLDGKYFSCHSMFGLYDLAMSTFTQHFL